MQQTKRAALVEQHAWIVAQFVAYYSSRGNGADLAEAGLLGLCEAAQKFKLGRGVKFATYAWLYVKGCMLEELRLAHVVPVSKRAALGKTQAPVPLIRTESLTTSGQDFEGADNARPAKGFENPYTDDIPSGKKHARRLESWGLFIESTAEQSADAPLRRRAAIRRIRLLPTPELRRVAFRALRGRTVEQIATALEMPPGRVLRLLAEAEHQLEQEAA